MYDTKAAKKPVFVAKNAQHETRVEVYSHGFHRFTRQISGASHFNSSRIRNKKIISREDCLVRLFSWEQCNVYLFFSISSTTNTSVTESSLLSAQLQILFNTRRKICMSLYYSNIVVCTT